MKDLWDTINPQVREFATKPKKLAASGIKRLIERAIWTQGLRKKLKYGQKRHHFKPFTVSENGLKLVAR